MSFQSLAAKVAEDPAIIELVGRKTTALSVVEPARAIALAGVALASQRVPLLVVTPTTAEADRLVNDLSVFLGEGEALSYPAWETLPFERVSPSVETMGRRLATIWALQDEQHCPKVVVAPVRALIQRLSPTAGFCEPIIVGVEDSVDPQALAAQLVAFGYRRESQVEHRGEFSVRGSIVDVFPSTEDRPIRIDLWGDEVERLCEFSVSSQRSTVDLSETSIFPCRELLATDAIAEKAASLKQTHPWGVEQWQRFVDGQSFDGMESWLPWLSEEVTVLPDLLSSDAMVALVDPSRLRKRAADLIAEETDLAASLAKTWGAGDDGETFPQLHVPFDRLLAKTSAPFVSVTSVPQSPDVAVMSASGWESPGEQMAARLGQLLVSDATLVATAQGAGTAQRSAKLLRQWGLDLVDQTTELEPTFDVGGTLCLASLERGFILSDVGVAVLTEADLSGRRRSHRKARRPSKRQSEGFFDGLQPGHYVVHHQHGVGRFAGMVTRAIGGFERDYLLLDYRGDDKLYLPSDQIELIRRFTGGDSPRLNRLGGADFAKAKAKVRSAVAEVAQELVVLYQKRISLEGHSYEPDTAWQQEVESAFPYELTPDQAEAVNAIKDDMEAPSPMDRLVVGDVGFGKTEVALRAAFKAIQGGKQVAMLVPTTLLAHQHYQTFVDRFAPYPTTVEVLSRFLTAAQARKVVERLNAGEVDMLIGTHRILSKDIEFKDLGLLIVDEEQRFGVTHKEKIKNFKANVDVLTLSATPIPRTLEMSLTGIRDMSVLNTPPADRQPILTYVGDYDERAVAEAIRRELLREGQVFYVHNRVQSIEKVAQDLRNLVPEARVAIAHGQMDEGTLEKVVLDFWEGEFDVLVCTTIIESGIDMPTVNTMVLDRAELLGLGQLHQLRGRVGRSGQRAYAYLFTRPDASLSQEAFERLKTIGEATELGSGFKIAMRDLEIRGAGNLLGAGQSGHISSVGYDLYCQMVTEAVAELKGETQPEAVEEIKIDLPVDAHIPTSYIESEQQRIEAYRALTDVRDQESLVEVTKTWQDRYGPLPEPVAQLLSLAQLKAYCAVLGVKELNVIDGPGFGGPKYIARFGPIKLKASQEVRFKRLFPKGSWKPTAYGDDGGQLHVGLMRKSDLVKDLLTFFDTMFADNLTS